MPGCAAIGCNNRSEKGFTMKCFPRDPVLRKIWKQRVGRADWEPSNNSFLCHVHFERSQRIVLANGRIKLKKGALPSIFTVTSTRKSQKKKNIQVSDPSINEDLDNEVEFIENDDSLIYNLVNEKAFPNTIDIQSEDSASISGQILQNVKIISGDALKDLQNENIIIVADENNREIGKIINNSGFFMIENERGKENFRILPKPDKSEIKVEIKEEIAENAANNTDYDEIERQMKEICHDNEAECSSGNKSFQKVDYESLETESIFSLDLENGLNDSKESLNQETESNQTVLKSNIKRKSTEDVTNIIYDLENESITENKSKKPKLISIATNYNGTGKPIIKNDIQFKLKNNIIKDPGLSKNNKINNTNKLKLLNPSIFGKLNDKLIVQGEVIEKLTNQLFYYKDIEKKMQSLAQELCCKKIKIETLTRKLMEKKIQPEITASKPESINFTNLQQSESIKNKFNMLGDNNRKLMKALTTECENRKKLEFQSKSKDNQIKYLNWKLEKASKFLDRAEKNATNYKKKMLAMQAFIKRKNLNNEKSDSTLDEFLIGHLDKNFSNDSIKKALEIFKSCGLEGYKKLLNYEFPLPSLNDLRKKFPTEVDYCEPEEDEEVSILQIEKLITPISMSNIKMENIEFLDEEFLNKSDETISGTVEDIFNESDGEDLDLEELKKHMSIDSDNCIK